MSWLVRWLVVDTGTWLSGRKVLLPGSALGHLDPERSEVSVRLTKQEVNDSPNIDTKRPVSRQMEASVYDYYGWSPYWIAYMGDYNGGVMMPSSSGGSMRRREDIATPRRSNDDPHLRSIEEIVGYHIHADDGEIGHVEDLLLEDADWSIHYLVVDTKNRWPGKRVLVSPRSVAEIDWTDHRVNINVDRQKVKGSPTYNGSTTVDRVYENNTVVTFNRAISLNDRLSGECLARKRVPRVTLSACRTGGRCPDGPATS